MREKPQSCRVKSVCYSSMTDVMQQRLKEVHGWLSTWCYWEEMKSKRWNVGSQWAAPNSKHSITNLIIRAPSVRTNCHGDYTLHCSRCSIKFEHFHKSIKLTISNYIWHHSCWWCQTRPSPSLTIFLQLHLVKTVCQSSRTIEYLFEDCSKNSPLSGNGQDCRRSDVAFGICCSFR